MLHQRNVNSSFIHPLLELATEHFLWNSLWRALLPRLALLNMMKGFKLVPSAFPVRQTETQTLTCPVDFMETSFESVFSTVVSETISFQTGVSMDVHHVCYNTINHIRWTVLSSCSFSSKRQPIPSHKLFTPSTTSNKQTFDGRIVITWSFF